MLRSHVGSSNDLWLMLITVSPDYFDNHYKVLMAFVGNVGYKVVFLPAGRVAVVVPPNWLKGPYRKYFDTRASFS